MSFEFTVLSDDRFIEILQAWVDSPWPKTAEDGYALRDRFGWTPDYREPALFTSDVRLMSLPRISLRAMARSSLSKYLSLILRLRRLGGIRWSRRRRFIGISVRF